MNNNNIFVKVDGHSYLNLNDIHNIYVDKIGGTILYGRLDEYGDYEQCDVSKKLIEKILKHCEVIE